MGPNPSEGLVDEPWKAQSLSRVLGHHLAANPSEGLVEEARMTECEVSVPFWPDDLSELVSSRNNPLIRNCFPFGRASE